MGLWLRFCAAALLALIISVQTAAEKFVLKPVADTSLVERSPTNNFGKAPRLLVGGDLVGRNRSLVKFDLSSIPSTSKVVAASLRINIPDGHVGGIRGPLWVFRTLRNWNEGTKTGESAADNESTWLNNPGDPWRQPGGKWLEDFSFERSASSSITGDSLPAFIRFDSPVLAKDLQGWLDRPESNFGWFFSSSVDDCYDQLGNTCDSVVPFASREDQQNAPELTLFTGQPDAPRAFLNGEYLDQTPFAVDTLNARVIHFESPYQGGHVFFTLDGTKPTLLSTRYERSFGINAGDVLRAVSFSSDYTLGGTEMSVAFEPLPILSLNVSTVGNGIVYRSPSPNESPGFSSNTVIRLVAATTTGWIFTGWTGDIQTTETTLEFRLTRNMSLQANFVPLTPALTARRIQQNFLLVQFNALPNYDYYVESSSSLGGWTQIQTFTGKIGLVDAIFPLESSPQPKFYRVLSTPKGSPNPY